MNEFFSEKLRMLKQDKEQSQAYEYDGSLIIKAGPGSGKTNVLTLKMAQISSEKVKFPRKIACITFSNQAKDEIRERMHSLVDYTDNNAFIGTVHSFCLSQILKPYMKLYDYGLNNDFTIISNLEKEKWFIEILKKLSLDSNTLSMTEMDKVRTYLTEGESEVSFDVNHLALKVSLAYEKKLLEHNMVDFISIIKIATSMVQNEVYIRKCLEAKFPYILVDEYQDLGKPFHEMVLSLAKDTNIKIIVVGDPNQSIYSFNGAIPGFLLELEKIDTFYSIELKNNYRSHQQILDLSLKTMNLPAGHFKAKKTTEKEPEINLVTLNGNHEDQYRYIANEIIPFCLKNGIEYKNIAILIRAKKKVQACQKILEQNHIPHYVMTLDFNRGRFVKFLEDCASWILDNRKVYFKNLLSEWLYFKYDKIQSNRVNDEERKILYLSLSESKKHASNIIKWTRFMHYKLKIMDSVFSSKRNVDDNKDYNMFVKYIKENKEINLDKFSKLGIQENAVSLLTMHSSKGLEYEVVIMPAMEEGTFPFYKTQESEMEEEKRIFFVSLTRAKSICYFLISNNLNGYPKHPSRFIKDLDFTSIINKN